MKRSTQRLLTTHTGSLPRPAEVVELLLHEQKHPGADASKLKDAVRRAVSGVVEKQVACGLDIINDGEQGRTDYTTHVKDRRSSIGRPAPPRSAGRTSARSRTTSPRPGRRRAASRRRTSS